MRRAKLWHYRGEYEDESRGPQTVHPRGWDSPRSSIDSTSTPDQRSNSKPSGIGPGFRPSRLDARRPGQGAAGSGLTANRSARSEPRSGGRTGYHRHRCSPGAVRKANSRPASWFSTIAPPPCKSMASPQRSCQSPIAPLVQPEAGRVRRQVSVRPAAIGSDARNRGTENARSRMILPIDLTHERHRSRQHRRPPPPAGQSERSPHRHRPAASSRPHRRDCRPAPSGRIRNCSNPSEARFLGVFPIKPTTPPSENWQLFLTGPSLLEQPIAGHVVPVHLAQGLARFPASAGRVRVRRRSNSR